MGIRIHRAMGWGMSIDKLALHYKGPLDAHSKGLHAVTNGLFSLFDDADVNSEAFNVPKEVCQHSFLNKANEDGMASCWISEPHILAKQSTDFGRLPFEPDPASYLFDLIGYDDYTDIVFYPDLHTRSSWHRYNDDMDYYFEQWRGDDVSRDADPETRDFVKYIPYNPCPYGNNLMNEAGGHEDWQMFTELRKRPDLVPAVHSSIRWYLTKLGVMDNEGVNQLRPVIAQWWS
ncbi:hypothetical protein FHV99_004630 [Ochrobactrum sp. P20RRXII]|nr:hypothetical protein [Ochrobactrum sp. P20RRXII]NIH77378.1 hypothetical protein [Ochrobactrum sp. P20RRXII]